MWNPPSPRESAPARSHARNGGGRSTARCEAVLRWLDVADRYGPENVVISTGAKQCLFNLLLAVCNPADCVLFDAAPWVSYQPLATAAYAFPVMVLPLGEKRAHLKARPTICNETCGLARTRSSSC